MIWFLILIASLNFLTKTSICGIIFEIVETRNDLTTMVSTKIITTSNTNISLTCKIIDSENKTYFDNEVVWFKRKKGLRHNKPEILGEGNLNFNPIKIKNEGKYFCASFTANLYKIITIIVRPVKLSQKRRLKRADVKSNIPSPNSLIYNSESTTGNLPIPLTTNGQVIYRSYVLPTLPTETKRLMKENQNQLYDYSNTYIYNSNKSKTIFSRRGFSYANVIAAVVGVILIVGGVLYRLMKRFDLYTISPERQISELEPACHHPTCGQYCTFATDENLPNRVRTVSNGNIHSTPILRVLPSMVELPNTSCRTQESAHNIDSPPSYDNSVKNCDNYDNPPSYSEALSYMSVHHLPNVQPQNFNRNLSHNT